MKKILAFLAALVVGLAASAGAQVDTGRYDTIALVVNYDVSSASYIYCSFSDSTTVTLDPLGQGRTGAALIKTSGSSTTVTSKTSGQGAFTNVVVGDLLRIELAGKKLERIVTVKGSADSITIDTAIDLSVDPRGYSFRYKHFFCGTGANDGWFYTGGLKSMNVVAGVTTLNATSLDFTLDCKADSVGALSNQVFTKNFTSATYPANVGAVGVSVEYDMCRVGWKINTDTGAQSVQTHLMATAGR